MDPKKSHHYDERRPRLHIPQRGDRPASVAPAQQQSKPDTRVIIPDDLAKERESLGFDDIPVDDQDMSDVRFRDIFRAWAGNAIKHSDLEKKLASTKARGSRLKKISNDLKWALQADLDEPVTPQPKTPQPTAAPPKTSQQHQITAPHTNTTAQPSAAESKTIDININFGSLPKIPALPSKQKVLAFARKYLLTRKSLIVTSVAGLAVVAVVITSAIMHQPPKSPDTSGSGTSQTPDYATLLPSGKSIDTLGGWHRVSPEDRAAVFAYADKIDDVAINVTQQPIPDSFQPNIDQHVADLAKAYVATDKVSTGSLTIYIGTSGKGPQSVIFTKNNVLILIKSAAKISDNSWTSYAQALN